MASLFCAGKTLQEIGDLYGVTRERVRQIIAKQGVTAEQGGCAARSFIRATTKHRALQKAKSLRIQSMEAYFGCAYDELLRLNGGETPYSNASKQSRPAWRYMQQRRTAKRRGIEWHLTFIDWWRIWDESGKWEQRGRGQGYCMARYGDSGPYSIENVYICTIGENFSDSYLVHSGAERAQKRALNRKLA